MHVAKITEEIAWKAGHSIFLNPTLFSLPIVCILERKQQQQNFFFGTGFWTQDLILARQALSLARHTLYHLNMPPILFCFSYFSGRIMLFPWGQLRLQSSAGIRSVSHHVQPTKPLKTQREGKWVRVILIVLVRVILIVVNNKLAFVDWIFMPDTLMVFNMHF
jgi:hypothetical protein